MRRGPKESMKVVLRTGRFDSTGLKDEHVEDDEPIFASDNRLYPPPPLFW